MTDNNKSITALKQAFTDRRLTLFVGAGVSVANGLPTWERLVLSVYFATISEQNMQGWRPFSNYLYAISEWYLRNSKDPLEIVARKVRSCYKDTPAGERAFLEAVRDGIYGVGTYFDPSLLLSANPTLNAVVSLCCAKTNGQFGVRSVISYNYDSLVEMTLADFRGARPIYSERCQLGKDLPIFHVHGYVPYNRATIRRSNEIVFTEERYNVVASDPYSWSNIVQLREMSSNVGLMVGLSMSDRNIRRLLDALSRTPVKPNIFALFQRPKKIAVPNSATDRIHRRAIKILAQFRSSGIKGEASGRKSEDETGFTRERAHDHGISEPAVKSSAAAARKAAAGLKSAAGRKSVAGRKSAAGRKGEKQYQYEIRGIIEQVELLEQKQQDRILGQLGITPIWYDNHRDIPAILRSIHA